MFSKDTIYNKIFFLITSFLFVFLPILFNPLGFEVFSLPRVFFLYFISLILVFIFFKESFQSKKLELKTNKLLKILFFFVLFIIISFIASKDKHTALWGYPWDYEGLISWLCYFIIFYFSYHYFRDIEKIKKLSLFLVLPVFVVSIYAIGQYFLGWELMEWFQKTEIKRAFSFLGHPSYLGIYYVLYLPLLVFSLQNKTINKKYKLFIKITIGLGVLGLVLSFSRAAWLAFIFMIFLFVILNYKKTRRYVLKNKKKILLLSILLFIVLILLSILTKNSLINQVERRFISIADRKSPTIQVRSILYRQSLLTLKDNFIFGVGPDNFVYIGSKYYLKYWDLFHEMIADKAHNQFLDFTISFGIGGIVSYVLFLFFWFKIVLKNIKGKEGISNIFLKTTVIAVSGYLLTMQFHYSTIDLSPMFWFLLGSSLGILAKEKYLKERKIVLISSHNNDWSAFRVFFYVIFGILFVILVFNSTQRVQADYNFRKGLNTDQDINKSIFYLEKAVKKNKFITNYYLALNNFYINMAKKEKNNFFFEQAIDSLIYAQQYVPLDYRLSYELGETYLKIIDYVENKNYIYNMAESAYIRTLKLYPNLVDANLKLGVVSAHLGKDKKAIFYWKKCVELNEKQSQCYYNLYIVYDKLGKKDLAKKNYDKYLDLELQKSQ